MTRPLFAFLCMLALVYLFALGWSVSRVAANFSHGKELFLKPVPPLTARFGETLELELEGGGFAADTRVLTHMDVNNRSAVVASYPVEGIIYDMELVGNQLFVVGNKGGIRSFDVRNPLKPVMKGKTARKTTMFLDMERRGRKFFFSCANQGVMTCRLSETGKLIDWKTLPTAGAAVDTAVVGRYLYVAVNSAKIGLLVFDLDKLDDKAPVANVITGFSIRGVEAYGNTLYVPMGGKGGVGIFRLNADGLPVEIGRITTKRAVRSVTVTKKNLYVLENNRITQYSLEKPEEPQLIAEQEHFSLPHKLYDFGETIFVSDNHSGLGVIDFNQAVLPEQAEFFSLGGDTRAAVKVGGYLYAAVANVGIKVLNLDKVKPRQVAKTIKTPGLVRDFKIIKDHIYISDNPGGLIRLDLKNPGSMERLSFSWLTGFAHVGKYMYLAHQKSGIEVFAVDDPAAPRKVAEWDELRVSGHMGTDGLYLLLMKGRDGLNLYRLNGLEPPRFVDKVEDIIVSQILIESDLVIVAGEREGVRLYRIEDDKLVFLSRLKLPFPLDQFSIALNLKLEGDILFIANGDAGLMIADIKDPGKPKLLSSVQVPGQATDMLIEGDRLYLLCRYNGLHTIDISNLSDPRLLASVSLTDVWRGLQRDGDLLYIGNRFMGVTAIPFPEEIKAVEVVSDTKLKVRIPSPKIPGRYCLQVTNSGRMATAEGVLTFQ